MDIELKYGDGKTRIHIPEKADVSILQPLQLPILEVPGNFAEGRPEFPARQRGF